MKVTKFTWNPQKAILNAKLHKGVTFEMAKECFFNPYYYRKSGKRGEIRYFLLGITNTGRYLTVIFSRKKNIIRIISARDMDSSEKKLYKKSGVIK